jgi:hypothetical protein
MACRWVDRRCAQSAAVDFLFRAAAGSKWLAPGAGAPTLHGRRAATPNCGGSDPSSPFGAMARRPAAGGFRLRGWHAGRHQGRNASDDPSGDAREAPIMVSGTVVASGVSCARSGSSPIDRAACERSFRGRPVGNGSVLKQEHSLNDIDAGYQTSFDSVIEHFVECLRSGAGFDTDAPSNLETWPHCGTRLPGGGPAPPTPKLRPAQPRVAGRSAS